MLVAMSLLWFMLTNPQAQQTLNPSIRGIVVDARTNAPIADARVTLIEAGQTAMTAADGRFEFVNVPPRTYSLTVSTIGYIFVRRRVEAASNTNLDLTVPLAEGRGAYQEAVTVEADIASKPKALGVSSQMELGSGDLAELRGVAADDPMRAIQALPGVVTGDDFQAEFSVRGSAFRHVGVVMDGTPTQLLMHTLRSANDSGSIAMINSDILSRGALFSGPHPRTHGDWLGSTLEFDVREGSRDRAGLRDGHQRHQRVGGFRGADRRIPSRVVVVLHQEELHRLAHQEDRARRGQHDRIQRRAGKADYDITSRQQLQFFAIGGDATYRDTDVGLANGIDNARSRTGMASLSWRYAHSRAVVTARLSFINARWENRGVVGQHLGEGTNSAVHWRAEVSGTVVAWLDARERGPLRVNGRRRNSEDVHGERSLVRAASRRKSHKRESLDIERVGAGDEARQPRWNQHRLAGCRPWLRQEHGATLAPRRAHLGQDDVPGRARALRAVRGSNRQRTGDGRIRSRAGDVV